MDEQVLAAFMAGLAMHQKSGEIRVPVVPADGTRYNVSVQAEGEPGKMVSEIVLRVTKQAPLFEKKGS